MKHICSHCNGTTFKVVKTYPCEDHTLRHLKCRACGTNVFTHEYIMRAGEYAWEKKRLILSDENVHQREELAWKAMRLLLSKE